VTISRYSGTGVGTFIVYSPAFYGGSDTVFAGDVIVEITDQVDSIDAVDLGLSSWQIEGSN
jgi:hypothetical protein